MRIAVIGAGISGLASAYWLSREHQVTLYEANGYLGGHTHTHRIEQEGRHYAIDTGFIVFNPENYPLFTQLLDELDVRSQPTSMSFSVQNAASGVEYGAANLDTLFCQRRNLASPRFLGMLRDLRRFYREAPQLLRLSGPGPSLGDYLARQRYGDAFAQDHLIPMAAALWSSPARQILDFPARYLVQFMANHQMLQVAGRPQWRVVQGGSARYVDALRRRWPVRERPSLPVVSVRRLHDRVVVATRSGHDTYDQIVLACHSGQALRLLEDASRAEREILGAIAYQENDATLHTDTSVLPRNRKAWAAWNAYVPAHPARHCTVSYCMNILQGIESSRPFIVTLNRDDIDPGAVLARMHYEHPVYTAASVAAQARKHDISGQRRTWYAGAYWGWGFHEDGMRSALDVARALGCMPAHRPSAEPACAALLQEAMA